jgi:hypothetical protein
MNDIKKSDGEYAINEALMDVVDQANHGKGQDACEKIRYCLSMMKSIL